MAKETKDFSAISGLPDELGIDDDLSKVGQVLSIRRDTRRYGKPMTIVSGFEMDRAEMKALASELKRRLACGGTVLDDEIELQGNHVERARDILDELGYQVA
ncbi:stress response translation initiation inhibitor YciH [Haloferax sp. MBLA0076]|uniref:Stress response translation initiation inhibitor YciH n=1 Tax=Haloferax litoreum TaxID=2666140 RepID=A0A6A8GFM2_9EURY|nr:MULTISPECIES: stress response translation initiation inhibitor YciH [Haloferax]KAB1193424.1 stress response translation initiation inhibitor YciH [Haloferax sp. CBA1148]MRX21935.1 stress response translation initiation inhibitor YciH [Haloferax litoreum]